MESIRYRLREHDIPIDGRDTDFVVGLATSWLRSAQRVRSAAENAIDPMIGPITAFTHVLCQPRQEREP